MAKVTELNDIPSPLTKFSEKESYDALLDKYITLVEKYNALSDKYIQVLEANESKKGSTPPPPPTVRLNGGIY